MEDILAKIYQEANEHLRASDKKRDQIIAFYLIVLGFLFSSLKEIYHLPKIEANVILLFIGLFGFILVLNVNEIRFWHIVYVNTAIVIENLMISKIPPKEEAVSTIWNKYTENIKKIPRFGTENLTFLGFLIISFLPFAFLLNLCLHSLQLKWVIVLFIYFIYVVVFYMFCGWYLQRMLSRGYEASWLLRMFILQKEEQNS